MLLGLLGARFNSFQSPEIQPYFEKWGFGPDMAMGSEGPSLPQLNVIAWV